jgi:hypothetical protein
MKQSWIRGLLLIAFVLANAGCGSSEKPEPRTRWAPVQTGTYIPRRIAINEPRQSAQPKKRVQKSKPTREKPERERRPAEPVEDPNFVPRGGFR